MTWVAGKTGTPVFAHDRMTLTERAGHCDAIQDELQAVRIQGQKLQPSLVADNARCHMQPYKWYVALVKDSAAPGAPYTRAIAVLAERNWRLDGRVDSAGDRGVNVAAEMAFCYIAQSSLPATAQGAKP